jgi:hypothetical protein
MYDAVHLFARALDELDRSQVKEQTIIKAYRETGCVGQSGKSKRRERTMLPGPSKIPRQCWPKCREHSELLRLLSLYPLLNFIVKEATLMKSNFSYVCFLVNTSQMITTSSFNSMWDDSEEIYFILFSGL